jgi:mycofactocin precursor
MNPSENSQSETQADLLAETLIEEISIDGMCGVY